MTAPVAPRIAAGDHRALVIPALVLLAVSVEPSALGISSSGSGVDIMRWAFLTPVYFGALTLALRSQRLGDVFRGPVLLLLGSAAVALIAAPFGYSAMGDTILAIGALSLAVLGAMWGRSFGFSRMFDVYGVVTFALCVLSLIDGTLASNGRLAGLYPAANALGIHGAVLVVDAVRRWLRNPGRGAEVLTHLVVPAAWMGVGALILIKTDSRTSVAAAIIGVVVLVRSYLPRMLRLTALGMALAIVVLGLTTDVSGDLGREVSRSGDLEEITTVTGRTDVWSRTLSLIGERPLVGYGTNGSVDVYDEEYESGRLGFEAGEAHNMILQSAMNGGVLSALLLLAGVTGIAFSALVYRDPAKAALLTVLVIHGVTESTIREPKDLWLMLAVIAAVPVIHPNHNSRHKSGRSSDQSFRNQNASAPRVGHRTGQRTA